MQVKFGAVLFPPLYNDILPFRTARTFMQDKTAAADDIPEVILIGDPKAVFYQWSLKEWTSSNDEELSGSPCEGLFNAVSFGT